MKHRLSGTRSYIENGAISLLDVAQTRDVGSSQMASADDFCVGGLRFLKSNEVPLGNDQDVRWRLRVDIFEGENVLVFVDFL